MKTCSKCNELKPLTEYTKDSRNKDGRINVCNTCRRAAVKQARQENPERFRQYDKNRYNSRKEWREQYVLKNREQINANKREWAKKNREKIQNTDRKRRYGVTKSVYKQTLVEQNNNCTICIKKLDLNKPRAVHTDHNHATGKFRGILCHNCNHILGHAKENIEILKLAIEYIIKHK